MKHPKHDGHEAEPAGAMAHGFGSHEAAAQVVASSAVVVPQSVPVDAVADALKAKYPQHSAAIEAGYSLHGAALVEHERRLMDVVVTTQKYRLSDGTIVPLTVD